MPFHNDDYDVQLAKLEQAMDQLPLPEWLKKVPVPYTTDERDDINAEQLLAAYEDGTIGPSLQGRITREVMNKHGTAVFDYCMECHGKEFLQQEIQSLEIGTWSNILELYLKLALSAYVNQLISIAESIELTEEEEEEED